MGRRTDGLALRHALPERLLPGLVAAMSFLAALTLAGTIAAGALAQRWQSGAAAILTIQVPDGDRIEGPGRSRLQAVLAALTAEPAVSTAHAVPPAELTAMLAPWLGPASSNTAAPDSAGGLALPLPAVIQARLRPGRSLPAGLASTLDTAAPGTLVEPNQGWSDRLIALTASLQACAALALLVVASVSVAVVAAATRAGLAARRQAIEIVHDLGAADGYIAGRFAARTTALALSGAAIGSVCAVPLLLLLCRLAAPFAGGAPDPASDPIDWLRQSAALMPVRLWIALPLLPPVAGGIGWLTAQATVRSWLRRLP